MRRLAMVGWLCVVLGGWAALVSAAPAAGKVDLAAVREKAVPAVCRVTVENAWGISQSVSTGFLMGDGRFAVVDLGAVRQAGVARATLHLTSGTRLTATEFGMADPSMGLAVLRVEAPPAPTPALTPASRAFSLPPSRGLSSPSSESEPAPAAPAATESVPAARGLGLASALPVLDGTGLMATVGWRWGDRLDVTAGRVVKGPTIQSVASRSHVVPPQGVDSFLRVDGGRIDAASGSPVLDADGTVVAVRLDVAAKGLTVALAMPAMVLRQSLLESTTELKPLADLPAPLWPVDTLRLPGEPTSLAEFTQASQRIADAMVCDTCKGKGTISVGGGGRWGGGGRNMPCIACLGTGIRIDAEIYDMLTAWAEQGARVAWAPRIDDRRRTQVRKIGVEMLARLARVGRNLRRVFGFTGGLDLVPPQAKMPHGIVLYVQVEDEIEGPDGRYLLLRAINTRSSALVRVDDLLGRDGRGPLTGRTLPQRGTWFALAGAVVSRFDTGEHRGIYVLPFEWTPYVPDPEDPRDNRNRPQPGGAPPPPTGGRRG